MRRCRQKYRYQGFADRFAELAVVHAKIRDNRVPLTARQSGAEFDFDHDELVPIHIVGRIHVARPAPMNFLDLVQHEVAELGISMTPSTPMPACAIKRERMWSDPLAGRPRNTHRLVRNVYFSTVAHSPQQTQKDFQTNTPFGKTYYVTRRSCSNEACYGETVPAASPHILLRYRWVSGALRIGLKLFCRAIHLFTAIVFPLVLWCQEHVPRKI